MPMSTIMWLTYLGLVLMALPFQFIPTFFPMMDKVGHFMVSSMATIHLSHYMSPRKSVLVAFLIGSVIEYSQNYTSRSASMDDVLANTAGILFAWFLLTIFKRRNSDEKTN